MNFYQFKLTTPVIFLVFNRPDNTAQVFEAIRQAQPSKLLVVADGARPHQSGEVEKCVAVRAIIETVDWDCEVLKNYSDVNLGCKKRVSSGLDWAFSLVEEAIIVEDDCLPHPTFFRFCQELLEQYRDDKRIMAISGDNFQFGRSRTEYSYYFSIYNHCWGWATWRRAWQYYDVDMKLWEKTKNEALLTNILANPFALQYWTSKFEQTYQESMNTWDYQWTLACWLQNGLTILPNINLVANTGFGANSTHTKSYTSPFANMSTEAVKFPLQHPPFVFPNRKADDFTQRKKFGLVARGFRKAKDIFFLIKKRGGN